MATTLKRHIIQNFAKGYNSYTQSKSQVEDEEIPYGMNVVLDDNGSATKRNGCKRYGGEIVSGHLPMGAEWYRTDSANELIVACNTGWYKKSGVSWTLISGKTFTADQPTHFVQAHGRLYGCNGVDNLCYYDGSTIIEVTGGATVVAKRLAFIFDRLWATVAGDGDRVKYSNPGAADGTIGNFGTFDVSLPTKNAGYLDIRMGSGVQVTNVYSDGDTSGNYLYVEAKNIVKRFGAPTAQNDGSVVFPEVTMSTDIGCYSPEASVKVGNDRRFYGGDNLYSRGEVAQYANIRTTNKSGRIRSEINSITTDGKPRVAMAFHKDRIYTAYSQGGSGNDRVVVEDIRLNAFGTPYAGWSVSKFLKYEEDDGTLRFLGLSSKESYVYELDTGLDDNGTPIQAVFETKSTDCGLPNVIKRFAFIDVPYSMVYGTLTYEVFIDEVSSITGTLKLGNSSSRPVGIGSVSVGTHAVGKDYGQGTAFASLASNATFSIPCNYTPGKKVSVRFSNANLGEQFKVNGLVIWYKPGNVNEGR